jgi:HD-GYP domain-containing protein (c-di-GMP phosphodiesterase class II)
MNDLFLQSMIILDFAIKTMATVVILLSYLETKNKLFLWWSLGWAFFTMHAYLEYVLIGINANELWFLRHFIWAICSVFFFGGIALSLKTRISSTFYLILLTVASFFSAYCGVYIYDSWFLSALPSSMLNGSMFILSGIYYYKITVNRNILYNRLIVVGFILTGIHNLDYPFLRDLEGLAPYGFMICAILSLIVGLGMILKSKAETGRLRKVNLERIREIAALYSVTSTVSRGKELDQILYTVLDNVLRTLRLDGGVIFLLSKETGDLILKAQRGISEEYVKVLNKVSTVKESATKKAIEKNEVVIITNIPDAKVDEDLKQGLLKDRIDNYVALPLRSGSKVLGALVVGSRKPRRYASQDIRLLESIGSELGIAVDNKQLIENLDKSYLSTILTLTDMVEAKDHYTRRHSEDVTKYAVETAKEMGLSDDKIEKIRLAAQLHDLGKISISDSILLKEGKLTKKEWQQIKEHPEKAVQILKPLTFLHGNNGILDYIRSHHERYDGQGYPNGFKGKEIRLGARILALADAYHAMTSSRPYRKKPLTKKQAIGEIKRNAGKQFDPEVVNAFLKTIEREKAREKKY